MRVKLSDILETLPTLSQDELTKLTLRLAAVKALGPKREKQNDWLLVGIQRTLVAKGLPAPLTADSPGFVRDLQSYHKRAPDVRSFFESKIPSLGGPELTVLGDVIAQSLVRYVSAAGAPASFRTLVQCLDRAQEAVEDSFPGYIDANLLPMILRSRREVAE